MGSFNGLVVVLDLAIFPFMKKVLVDVLELRALLVDGVGSVAIA